MHPLAYDFGPEWLSSHTVILIAPVPFVLLSDREGQLPTLFFVAQAAHTNHE